MADEDRPSADGILKHFEIVEWIVDLLSGVFLLVLFGPLFTARLRVS